MSARMEWPEKKLQSNRNPLGIWRMWAYNIIQTTTARKRRIGSVKAELVSFDN